MRRRLRSAGDYLRASERRGTSSGGSLLRVVVARVSFGVSLVLFLIFSSTFCSFVRVVVLRVHIGLSRVRLSVLIFHDLCSRRDKIKTSKTNLKVKLGLGARIYFRTRAIGNVKNSYAFD